MPGTLLMRDPAETDALVTMIVMDKEPAHPLDGAKEPQGQQRMLTTDMMRPWPETNALQTHQTAIGLTETTTVTETEPAPHTDGAKEHQDDDLHPKNIKPIITIDHYTWTMN